jgi:hypothetical protein
MEQGVSASQQRTKHTPPHTLSDLPNQQLDFKFLFDKHAIFSSFKNCTIGF